MSLSNQVFGFGDFYIDCCYAIGGSVSSISVKHYSIGGSLSTIGAKGMAIGGSLSSIGVSLYFRIFMK